VTLAHDNPKGKPMTTSGNTVVIACKLPAGIYMQGYVMQTTQEPILGGGFRDVPIAVPKGPRVKIKGNAAPQGSVPDGLVQGGYVLTHDVPAETAKAWFEANKDADMVRNKLVFYAEKVESATSQAKNNHAVLSGLERLNVGTKSEQGREVPADPRWPRSNNANVSAIRSDSK
jgi:hypothetical protein